ncbi:MAG TPA: hypothetical protein VGF20_14060 [Candidatus Acidoferrum sp.]|jgi:hypothetical protein
MFITRTELLGSFFSIAVGIFLPLVARSQSAGPPTFLSEKSAMLCGEGFRPDSLAEGQEDRWSVPSERTLSPLTRECLVNPSASAATAHVSTESFLGHRHSDIPPASSPETPRHAVISRHVIADPPLTAADTSLAVAHEAVLEILSADNPCSMWLRKVNPEVAAIFQTLTFEIEKRGADYAIQERLDGVLIKHGPYSARTTENTGPGTLVTLNANGPFFHSRVNLHSLYLQGGSLIYSGDHTATHVGPYDGGSFRAQIIILLHELAHVIGAIPEDDSSKFGFTRSQNNTVTVLLYCRSTTDAFVRNNAVVLTTGASDVPRRY